MRPPIRAWRPLHLRWVAQGWSEDEIADRRIAASNARLAIERDRNDAVALAIFGHIQSYLLKDYGIATDYLNRAMAVGPSCAVAWGYSSLTCGYLGDFATAVAQAERAVRLSPLGPEAFWFEHFLSQAYYLNGRYKDAVAGPGCPTLTTPSNGSQLALSDCPEPRSAQ